MALQSYPRRYHVPGSAGLWRGLWRRGTDANGDDPGRDRIACNASDARNDSHGGGDCFEHPFAAAHCYSDRHSGGIHSNTRRGWAARGAW